MNKSIGAYIMHYKNVVSEHNCQEIIKEMNEKLWQQHTYSIPTSDESFSYENDLEVSFDESNSAKFLHEKIKYCISDYLKALDLKWFTALEGCTVPRFNRYKVGTEMRLHCDHISTIFDGTRRGSPILTVLGALNNDYEGGEFVMLEDLVIPLKAGEILVFPSTFLYPHEVRQVTKGIRYSYVSWAW